METEKSIQRLKNQSIVKKNSDLSLNFCFQDSNLSHLWMFIKQFLTTDACYNQIAAVLRTKNISII